MTKTKVFKSGNSQAVRIPKKYRIKSGEVLIKKEGKKLIIIPKENKWDELFYELESLRANDFLQDRNQPVAQEREPF
ncbi:MAG: antitoxin [bacterium]|nr:MAG: antitoxin [bacterium]